MKLAPLVACALPIACAIVACAADVRLGDLPVGDPLVDPAADGADSSSSSLAMDADARDTARDDAPGAIACVTKNCEGQPCIGGVCQPIELAIGQSGALYLAIDDTDVFWGTAGHTGAIGDPNLVAKTTKVPGGPLVVLSADGSPVRGIAVDATQVYWVRQTMGGASVSRASKVDGAGQLFVGFMPGATDAQGLARDSTSLYAVNGTEIRAFLQTDVMSPGVQLTGALGAGVAAALDGDAIFVADRGSSAVDFATVSTGAVTPSGVLAGAPVDVAVDATHVYFAAETVVGRIARATRTVETIANGLTGAVGIAVDASFVYFTTQSSVRRAPKGGSVTTTLASGLTKGGRLVVDGTFVYFADFGRGSIGRIPK